MSKKLTIAVAVLAATIAVTLIKFNAEEASDKLGATPATTLDAVEVDDIDTLDIAAPGKPAVTLAKQGNGWVVSSPVKAPAAQGAVEAALEKLKDLKITGVAATQAKNHDRLEVTTGKAIAVTAKQGEAVLGQWLIGAYRAGNTMVRGPKQDLVATVQGSIRYAFEKDIKDWRDRTVTELALDNVAAATFEGPGGTLRLTRSGSEFALSAGEPTIENFDATKARSLVSSAARLTASDFADPNTPASETGFEQGTTITLTLAADGGAAGAVVHVGAEKDGMYFLKKDGDPVIYRVSSYHGKRFTGGPAEVVTAPSPAGADGMPTPGAHP